MLDNGVDITNRHPLPSAAPRQPVEPDDVTPLLLTDAQQGAAQAIDGFIADPRRELFVVRGPSGSGLSRIRSFVEQSHRFQNVTACKAGAVAARKVEIYSLGRLLGRVYGETRPWLRGAVILLDDAAVARGAEVAELRRRGARIVALVDPDLPPPVHGTDPAFGRPDIVLTERHPTALADPIRAQARAVLAGGDYHDDGSAVRVKASGSREDLLKADIVLCRHDQTRRKLNQHVRVARGFIAGPVQTDGEFDPLVDFPREDEPVVFWWDEELGRGEIGWLFYGHFSPGRTDATILLDDHNGGLHEPAGVRFRGMPCRLRNRDITSELDFAYVLQVAEIQAGRWRHVLLIDEMPAGHPERPRWLYAAFCAAETSLTILRKHNS